MIAEIISDVLAVQDDPPRTLSHMRGSKTIRQLRNKEKIPYGIDLVNATAFWDRYGSRGVGITVCVIDTGVLRTREDLVGADFSGSEDSTFLQPWNEDGHSHGTHRRHNGGSTQ